MYQKVSSRPDPVQGQGRVVRSLSEAEDGVWLVRELAIGVPVECWSLVGGCRSSSWSSDLGS